MPVKRRDFLKFLRRAGCLIDTKAGKGSHVVIRRGEEPPYTLPYASDLDDCYIKQCCKQFGLDADQVLRGKKKKKTKKS